MELIAVLVLVLVAGLVLVLTGSIDAVMGVFGVVAVASFVGIVWGAVRLARRDRSSWNERD